MTNSTRLQTSVNGQFLFHENGQTTHFITDDFTDPWKPSEVVLIQHGFGRHAGFWYHWIPALARHYRVIRRDGRGHGLSSSPRPDSGYDYSLATILDEIVELLDAMKIQKVHLLGESTGGMIAIAFAAKHPDRLHSLTVCATPTHLPASAQKIWALGHKDWEAACREMGARAFCEGLAKLPGNIGQPDPAYGKWWLDQMDMQTAEGFAMYARFSVVSMGID